MTHSSILRPVAGSERAFEDDELPGISVALDASAASELFEERWRAEGDHRLRASATSLHNVCYEPGRRCRIAWEVEVRLVSSRARRTIGVIEVGSGTVHVRDFSEDPELPHLAEAVTPDRATHHLSSFAPGSTVDHVHAVRYRPGSRCTLRYDMAGSPKSPVLFGKVLVSDAAYLLDVARAIGGSSAEGSRSPIVEPLGWCEPLRMLLLSPCWDATELHDVVFDSAVPAVRRSAWMYEAGSTLARLHAVPVSGLGRIGIGDDLAALRAAGDVVEACAPAMWPAFDAAVDRLATLPSTERSSVVSHGAFRTDQLLVANGHPVIVDLDGLCLADPARDLGNLMAYLRWKAIRQPRHAEFIQEAIKGFLNGYGRMAPTPQASHIAIHEAASMLKIAGRRFRRLDVTEWPLVPRLIEEAAELLRPPRSGSQTPFAQFTVARTRGTTRGRRAAASAALAEALDPEAMGRRLTPLLAESGPCGSGRNGTRAHVAPTLTAEVLTHRPGRRWTIRYAREDGAPTFIGKLYTDPARGRRTHEVMRWLWEHRRAGPGELGVPQTLGWFPDLGMLVYLPVGGRGLGELLLRPPGGSHALGALDRTADWLGELHGRPLPLDRMFDPERELVTVRGWATAIGERYPALGGIATGIFTRFQERVPDLAVRSPVPIHKDFRHHHVFVDRGIGVIDFDEVRLGDAAFDLGHFCAYLRVMGHLHDVDRSHVDRLQERFLNAYHGAAGQAWDDRLTTFMAYGYMKIASQLALGTHPGRGTTKEIAHRETSEMLLEAARALDSGGGARPS